MTLIFDPYVILIGQGRCLALKWPDVFTIYGKTVVNLFQETMKLFWAITARRGPWTLAV